MSRVLFAWEHGRNFGHAARMHALARAVSSLDGTPIFAVPADRLNDAAFTPWGPARWPVPRLASRRPKREPASFADILLALGFDDVAALRQAVGQWLELFRLARPGAVVLDYAPTAQLAACIAGLPALKISNGFDSPPPSCPLFGWRMRGAWLEREHGMRLDRLEQHVAEVARHFGARGSLSDMFEHPALMLDCVPQADPYGPRSEGCYVGPLGAPASTSPAAWPPGRADAPRVFAYLREGVLLRPALDALVSSGSRVLCVCPDAADDLLRRDGAGLRVVRQPVPISTVLAEADAVVNYGSTSLVSQVLLAGKPQWMLPSDVEKWLASRCAAQHGAGVVTVAAEGIPTAVSQVLHPQMADRAQRLAASLASWDGPRRVQGLLEGLIRRGSP